MISDPDLDPEDPDDDGYPVDLIALFLAVWVTSIVADIFIFIHRFQ